MGVYMPQLEAGPAGAIVREQAAVAAITARTLGAATCLVGVCRVEDFQALVVRRDSGLRRGRDLRDRRIGLPAVRLQSGSPRVHALRGATTALELAGMYHRHVQWAELPAAEAVSLTLPGAYCAEMAALRNGSVDAVYVRGPAGLEAARAAGTRVLLDIGAHPDPWVRSRTALLQVVTVRETLLRQHPGLVAQVLLERRPLLPAGMSLEEGPLGALDLLKAFMLRWGVVQSDFPLDSWVDSRPARIPPVRPSHQRTAAAVHW